MKSNDEQDFKFPFDSPENNQEEYIDVKTESDGRFTWDTVRAAYRTLNPSLIYSEEGPKLHTEAEAVYVLSKSGGLEMSPADFIDGHIRPTVYRSPAVRYPQVPIDPKFVALVKELNAKSGAPHTTVSSTINNILDRFFSSNIGVCAHIKAGITGEQ